MLVMNEYTILPRISNARPYNFKVCTGGGLTYTHPPITSEGEDVLLICVTFICEVNI